MVGERNNTVIYFKDIMLDDYTSCFSVFCRQIKQHTQSNYFSERLPVLICVDSDISNLVVFINRYLIILFLLDIVSWLFTNLRL